MSLKDLAILIQQQRQIARQDKEISLLKEQRDKENERNEDIRCKELADAASKIHISEEDIEKDRRQYEEFKKQSALKSAKIRKISIILLLLFAFFFVIIALTETHPVIGILLIGFVVLCLFGYWANKSVRFQEWIKKKEAEIKRRREK